MSKYKILSILAVGFFLVSGFYLFVGILTAAEADVTFPVAELGNCESKSACKAYCEQDENKAACIDFAEKKGLMPAQEIQRAKKFLEIGKGPGGCTGHKSCEAYCNKPDNISTCLDFAKKHNLLSDKEIDEAEKVAHHLRDGNELPGGCTDKASCEAYCSESSHARECLAFAEKAGFIEKEELEQARKFLPLLERGETPGSCKNKEQCEAYCRQEEHFSECSDFALKVGAINEEDHAKMKETGGRGPGGCRGQEQCQSFCNDPVNQEACLNFAQKHQLLDSEKIEGIREGAQLTREGFNSVPPQVRECIESVAGPSQAELIKQGQIVPGSELGQTISKCFHSMEGPRERELENGIDPSGNKEGSPDQRREFELRRENFEDRRKEFEDRRPDVINDRPMPFPGDFHPETQFRPEFQPPDRPLPDNSEGYRQPVPGEFPVKPPIFQETTNVTPPIDGPGLPPPSFQEPPPGVPVESAPTSLLSSKYLGAILRFILGF